MRRDEDALVVPQAPVRRTLELTLIDVERDSTEFALFQDSQKCGFNDHLPAGDVDQNCTARQSGKNVGAQQMSCLFCPWTSNRDEIGLPQQFIQSSARFKTRKSRRRIFVLDSTPPRSDDAHSSSRAELCDLLAYASGADNAYGFAAENDRFVASMVEPVFPSIAVAQVKTTGKVKECSQNVFCHR